MATIAGSASVLITPSFRGFRSQVRAYVEGTKGSVNIDVKANTAGALAEVEAFKAAAERDKIKLNVDADHLNKQFLQVTHIFQQNALKRAATINVKVLGSAALPALAYGAASAATGLTSLASAAQLIPGALSAAGAAIGTLAVGLTGLGDAFKALADYQSDSVKNAADVARATRDEARAQRDVASARRDALRELQDLNLELRGAALSEKDAILSVQEAYRDLKQGGFKDMLEAQRAQLTLEQRIQRLAEVRLGNARKNQDYYAAARQGVEGSDKVADALDQLASAQERLSQAGGLDELAAAFARLSPAGAEFVNQVYALKDSWDSLTRSVQTGLLTGLGDQITVLARERLPLLERGMTRVAEGLNAQFSAVIDALRSPQAGRSLDQIFANTASSLQIAAPGMQTFVEAFLKLSEVGSRFLPRIAEGFNNLMDRFANFVDEADADGRLEGWIDRGLNALTSLGNTFINVGSIFNSITAAFEKSGGAVGGLATSLENGSQRLADFLASTEGQNTLVSYFRQAREFIDQLKPSLAGVVEGLQTISDVARDWSQILLPILSGAAAALQENVLWVQQLLFGYLAWRTLKPIWQGVSTGLGMIYTAGQRAGTSMLSLGTNTRYTAPLLAQATGIINAHGDAAKKAGDKINGAAGATGTTPVKGWRGALGGLATILTPGGILLTALAITAPLAIDKMTEAHDRAAEAARRQSEQLDALKGSLDEVSGAMTRQTLSDTIKAAQSFELGGGAGNRNITQDVARTGLNPGAFFANIADPTRQAQREADFGKLDADTRQRLIASEEWKRFGPKWQEFGIDADTMARALGGDQNAANQVNQAREKMYGPGGSASDITGTFRATQGIPGNLTETLRAIGTPDSATVAQFGRTVGSGLATTANLNREASTIAFGARSLTPAGATEFGAWSPDGNIVVGADNRARVSLNTIPSQAWIDAATQRGDSVEIAGTRAHVTLGEESSRKFITGYKDGGLVGGRGGPRDDANAAMLSRGEWVTDAATTSILGHEFMANLPKYAEGGLVGGSLLGGAKWQLPKVLPKPSSLPSEGGAGAGRAFASAERRGLPVPAAGPDRTTVARTGGAGGFGLGKAWNWLKDKAGFNYVGDTYMPTPNYISDRGALTGANASGKAGLSTDWTGWGKLAQKPAVGPPRDIIPPRRPITRPTSTPTPMATPPSAPVGTGPAPGPTGGSSTSLGPTGGTSHGPTTTHRSGGAAPGPVAPPSPIVSTGSLPGLAGGVPLIDRGTGSEAGLQKNTVGLKRAIEAAFPEIKTIGGARADALKWHPSGLAIDVMIPNANTPEGKALGDRIWNWANQNAGALGLSTEPGVNIWRDGGAHEDHLHLVSTGGGLADGSESFLSPAILGSGGTIPGTDIPIPTGGGSGGTGILGQILGIGGGSAASSSGGGLKSPLQSIMDGFATGGIDGAFASEGGQGVTKILSGAAQSLGQIGFSALAGFAGIDPTYFNLAGGAISEALGLGKGGPTTTGAGDMSGLSGELPAELTEDQLNQIYADLGLPTEASANAAAGIYDPNGGAEQWRPLVRQIVAQSGVSNPKAWEDALVRQIQTESGGNPGSENPNDTNGKGGTQYVAGVLNFLKSTFDAYNVTGGDYMDPAAQIAAAIPYVKEKWGVDASGAPNQIGRGQGFKDGGPVWGAGTARSDSIPARLSNGEFVMPAHSVKRYGLDFMEAVRGGALSGFAGGGLVGAALPNLQQLAAQTAKPGLPPVTPQPQGQAALTAAAQGIAKGQAAAGAAKAAAPAAPDRGAAQGAAPESNEHNSPLVSGAIEAGAAAAGNALSTAASMGAMMGGGAGAGMAGSLAAGGAQLGGDLVAAGANILSSFLVGTVDNRGQGYGQPLLNEAQMRPQTATMRGPASVHNYGGVQVANLNEFDQLQQRRNAQDQMPYLSKY